MPPNELKLPVDWEVWVAVAELVVALMRVGAWAPHRLFFLGHQRGESEWKTGTHWQALAQPLFCPQVWTHWVTYSWHSWKGMGIEYWVPLGMVPSLQTQVHARVLCAGQLLSPDAQG